jgi:potassium-transporting ATPase potassium-binding subunit
VTVWGWLQIARLLLALVMITPLLGGYIDRVFSGERVRLARVLDPFECRLTALLAGREPPGQDWRQYAGSVVTFTAVCWLALFAILSTQSLAPFNPQRFGAPPWNLSFNIASSFVSNSSWQYYAGETTLSTTR